MSVSARASSVAAAAASASATAMINLPFRWFFPAQGWRLREGGQQSLSHCYCCSGGKQELTSATNVRRVEKVPAFNCGRQGITGEGEERSEQQSSGRQMQWPTKPRGPLTSAKVRGPRPASHQAPRVNSSGINLQCIYNIHNYIPVCFCFFAKIIGLLSQNQ